MSTGRSADVAAPPEATYRFTDADSPAPSDVMLASVTSHGWRVTDQRLPEHDPFRLLAFIEHRGDRFEVMQLGSGFEWHEFPSLAAAVEFVIASVPRLARERLGPTCGGRRDVQPPEGLRSTHHPGPRCRPPTSTEG